MKGLIYFLISFSLACSKTSPTFTVSGRCVFAGDTTQGIKNSVVEIEFSDGALKQIAVDTAGFYSVDLETGTYILRAYKRTDTLNGIDIADRQMIKDNLLGVAPFTNQWQWLASDVNGDSLSSTYDAFLVNASLLKVGYAKDFIGGFWVFVPSEYELPPLNGYFLPDYPKCVQIVLVSDIENVNFTGFRRGDVTMSADIDE